MIARNLFATAACPGFLPLAMVLLTAPDADGMGTATATAGSGKKLVPVVVGMQARR